jgi:hypothetical protein
MAQDSSSPIKEEAKMREKTEMLWVVLANLKSIGERNSFG